SYILFLNEIYDFCCGISVYEIKRIDFAILGLDDIVAHNFFHCPVTALNRDIWLDSLNERVRGVFIKDFYKINGLKVLKNEFSIFFGINGAAFSFESLHTSIGVNANNK